MPREITDDKGITWSCIQAFAGLGNDPEKTDAARIGGSDRLRVVCTPSGGAASVRLELPDRTAGMKTVGVLCGGFAEDALRSAGCVAIYRDPEDLLQNYERSLLAA